MGMPDDVQVTFHVKKDIKDRADTLLASIGMDMSTALNVFLCKMIDEAAIPFAVSAKEKEDVVSEGPHFVLIHNPVSVANFRRFSREELYEK